MQLTDVEQGCWRLQTLPEKQAARQPNAWRSLDSDLKKPLWLDDWTTTVAVHSVVVQAANQLPEELPIETTSWSANKGSSSCTAPGHVTGTEGGTWARSLEQLVSQEIILKVILLTKTQKGAMWHSMFSLSSLHENVDYGLSDN